MSPQTNKKLASRQVGNGQSDTLRATKNPYLPIAFLPHSVW